MKTTLILFKCNSEQMQKCGIDKNGDADEFKWNQNNLSSMEQKSEPIKIFGVGGSNKFTLGVGY